MNYTTNTLIENICLKESRRQKAVYLSGRIKRANQSPGFEWSKAIEGFSLQFKNETENTLNQVNEDFPESQNEQINWVTVILHFSEQPYKKGD